MAEFTVNLAIETLGSLVVRETKLLRSVKKKVESIKEELEIIRSFLRDADTKAAAEEEGGSNGGVVSTWVKQVREQAYHIEDVIDEYILNEAKHHEQDGKGLTGFLRKMCCFMNELKVRHGISSEIQHIKSSLSDIRTRAGDYNLKQIDQGDVVPHDSRVGSFFIPGAEVVGIESTIDQLIGLLVSGTSNRSVVAVVGEGGLGKTTLAGKIYKDDRVKKHFDCQAWITVGKACTKMDILRKTIQQFEGVTRYTHGEMDKMEEKDLLTTLQTQLKDKCYMVVFDDVWKNDFWGNIEHALIKNNKSSRIMLTTRNRGIADLIPFVNVHRLQPLPSDKAFKLFSTKAFGPQGCCPPELEKLSRDILRKCGGLPLAIVAVGGLLSNKINVAFEWKKLLEDLGSQLGSNSHLDDCNKVLLEGYCGLPHHLKSCLLYFGFFPESYPINCARLIRLWIAEGFVPYSKRHTSEQVAGECLADLINRSLVQVVETDFMGRPRYCRVHDLMHEIILRKTEYLGFSHLMNREHSNPSSKIRRISIQASADSVLESIKDSKIRSVSLFNVDRMPNSFMTTLVVDFKLIKVLEFEDSPIEYLPEGVGNLFHLHYLSLKNTKVEVLPKSIGKLLNLETLNLKRTLVTELPVEIKNLKKLRYLLIYRVGSSGRYEEVKVPMGFGSLLDLQKLGYVEANWEVLKELRKLRHLRKLGIKITNGNEKDLCACIGYLEKLISLSLRLASREEILDIESMTSPPHGLQSLFLRGNMKKLPDWIFNLEYIVRIGLDLSGLTDDPMRVLQAMPNLLELRLWDTCHDKQLHFKEDWFPKLKILLLFDFEGVESMIIDKGAMPNLEKLNVGPWPQLKEFPIGIEHLRNLKFLEFNSMLKKIYYMMEDEKWKKVTRHIPKVYVTYKMEGKVFYTTAKYLSSISPVNFEQYIEKVERSNESSHS
ncbi:disease resistance protein RPM1-like [Pistacia vera]|uniref:disease resistance protein RPM1-like n=1 Tax=Pistacia vera TaxID=55513 RepID=UPI001262F4DA|nr:disease resistance protein RPM1-like [Pistacia vera]